MIAGVPGFYVYVHSRLKTGEPFYVGKGCRDRHRAHYRRSAHWKNIAAKDGGYHSSFIATGLDEDLAFLIECEAIDKFRRLGVRLANRTDGGEGPSGMIHTEETKAKFAAAKIGKLRGPQSPEHRQKISLSQIGKTTPPSTRAKISAATSAAMKNPDVIEKMRSAKLGKKRAPHSEETKRKMSAAAMGKKKSAAARASMSIAQRKRFSTSKG